MSRPPSEKPHLVRRSELASSHPVTHEQIAHDIARFLHRGGTIEVLGTTRTLKHIAPPSRRAHDPDALERRDAAVSPERRAARATPAAPTLRRRRRMPTRDPLQATPTDPCRESSSSRRTWPR